MSGVWLEDLTWPEARVWVSTAGVMAGNTLLIASNASASRVPGITVTTLVAGGSGPRASTSRTSLIAELVWKFTYSPAFHDVAPRHRA